MTQADGDSRSLFDDGATNEIVIPDTLDRRVAVYLHRHVLPYRRAVAERELWTLLEFAVEKQKP